MPDHPFIYRHDPQTYDLLISRQDYEENLLQALLGIADFKGKDIADIGAATGRVAMLLVPLLNPPF